MSIDIDESLNVEQDTFSSMVMGVDVVIPHRDLIDYFILFKHLKNQNHEHFHGSHYHTLTMYIVAKTVEKMDDLTKIVEIWRIANNRIEKEIKSEVPQIVIKSSFVLAVLNSLSRKKEGLLSGGDLHFSMSEKETVMKQLVLHESRHGRKLEHHEDFEGICLFPDRYFDIVRKRTLSILEDESKSDITVTTADGGCFKLFADILCWKSHFFNEFSPDSSERELPKVIHIETMSKEMVWAMVQFIYTERFDLRDVEIMQKMFLKCHKKDVSLRKYIMKRMTEEHEETMERKQFVKYNMKEAFFGNCNELVSMKILGKECFECISKVTFLL